MNPQQKTQIKGVDLSGECPPNERLVGVRFGSGGEPLPFCNIRDGYNYAETNYLLRPIDRFQISAVGHHEINDRVEAYAQVFNIKYQQDYQMAANATPTTSAGYPRGTVYIPNAVNNPVFSPTLQNFWAQNAELFDPDGDGNYEVFNTGRRMLEFGERHFDYTTDAFLMPPEGCAAISTSAKTTGHGIRSISSPETIRFIRSLACYRSRLCRLASMSLSMKTVVRVAATRSAAVCP